MLGELVQAIKEKLVARSQPPYEFPKHIADVQLNPSLILLHVDRANPDGNALEYRIFPKN